MGWYVYTRGIIYYDSVETMLRALRPYQPGRLSEDFRWRTPSSSERLEDRPSVDFHPDAPSVDLASAPSRKFDFSYLLDDAAAACVLAHGDPGRTGSIYNATTGWSISREELHRLKGFNPPEYSYPLLDDYENYEDLEKIPLEPNLPANVEFAPDWYFNWFLEEYSHLIEALAGQLPHGVDPDKIGWEPRISYDEYRQIVAARPKNKSWTQTALAQFDSTSDGIQSYPPWLMSLDEELREKLIKRGPTDIPETDHLFPPDYARV